jgi:hypothetical protein
MVTLPPQLLCAIAAQDTPRRASAAEQAPQPGALAVPDLPRRAQVDLVETASAETAWVEMAPVEIAPVEIAPVEIALPEVASLEAASLEVASLQTASPEAAPPQAVSTQPAQDEGARPCELPRRERPGARGDEPRPSEAAAPSDPQPEPQPRQAAARRAFADDLSAFSQGIQDALAARGITGSLVSAMFNAAPSEEGPQS